MGGLRMSSQTKTRSYRRHRLHLELLETRLPLATLLGALPGGDVAIVAAAKPGGGGGGGGGSKPGGETAGNNLSYPVIWSEGVQKALPGTPGMTPILNGEWWYQWGTNGSDPNVTPASCAPDPDEGDGILNPDGLPLCDNNIPGTVNLSLVAGDPLADNPLPLVRAYVQKDPQNVWQAGSLDGSAARVNVDLIDWGDNLESVDWYTRSQVRTEVVLFENLVTPMTEYEMRHTSGWGIDEVHGLAATLDEPPVAEKGPGTRATVYSHCARLTIQKLLTDRDDPALANLEWVPGEGWTEPDGYEDDLINPHLFNGSVHEGGDGPGYYSAEINVKGRIIYGYTWNVRNLNEGPGDYRITYSFDESCGTATLNTYFAEGETSILVPIEESIVVAASEEGDDGESTEGGAVGVLVPAQFDGSGNLIGGNLTYMDVRILERSGGGGGGGKGGGGGGKGGGGGHLSLADSSLIAGALSISDPSIELSGDLLLPQSQSIEATTDEAVQQLMMGDANSATLFDGSADEIADGRGIVDGVEASPIDELFAVGSVSLIA